MGRNIANYTQRYLQGDHDFEKIMVAIRRKNVLQTLQRYKPTSVLEIGCGMESLCNHYNDYTHFVILEPSVPFYKKALQDICQNNDTLQHISCIDSIHAHKWIDTNLDILFSTKKDYPPYAIKCIIDRKSIILINDFLESINTQSGALLPYIKNTTGGGGQPIIICSALLHEVVNPMDFLLHIYRFCISDTILHINVPNAKSFHLLWAYKSGLISNIGELSTTAKHLQQHTTFTMDSLESTLTTCFYDIYKLDSANTLQSVGIIDKGSYFLKPFNHSKMSACIKSDIINNDLLLGLEKINECFPEYGAEIFINARFS